MMRMISTKKLAGRVLACLFAAAILNGCMVTTSALEKRLVDFKTKDLAQVQANADQIAAAEKTLAAVSKEVEALKDLRTKLETIDGKIDEITTKLAALDGIPARVTGAEASLTQQGQKLTTLRTDVEAAKASRAELLAGLAKAALKADMAKLSESTDTNVARLDNKDKELAGKDTELGTSISRLDKISDAVVDDLKLTKRYAQTVDTAMKALTDKTTKSMTAQDKKIAGIGGGVSTALTREISLLEKRILTLKEVLKGLDVNGVAPPAPAP